MLIIPTILQSLTPFSFPQSFRAFIDVALTFVQVLPILISNTLVMSVVFSCFVCLMLQIYNYFEYPKHYGKKISLRMFRKFRILRI